MVDGAQVAAQQSAGDIVGILDVGLVARPTRLTAQIADSHCMRERHKQVMEPLRLRPLLEGDVYRSAHAREELRQRDGLGGQNRSSDDATTPFADRRDSRCLVHVETHIFGHPLHESRSLVLSW
jgi:hypothetical protein